MRIQKIDRASIRTIENDIIDALEEVEEALGIDIKLNGGRFSAMGDTATVSLEITLPLAAVRIKEEAAMRVKLSGITKTTFVQNNKIYTIVDYHGNRPQYPIIAERADGKRYKFPLTVVQSPPRTTA